MASEMRIVNGGELSALVAADANIDVMRYLGEHQPSCHDETGEAWLAVARQFRR